MRSVSSRLLDLRASRDVWTALLSDLPRPEEHSSLATDDLVFPPLGCSGVGSAMLRQADRSLERALAGLEPEDTVTVDVPAVLHELRTALIHASHAVAVLAPARAMRVRHGLRIAWTAFAGPDERSGSLTSLTPFTNAMVATEVAALLRARSYAASPRWHEISSVRLASDHLRGQVADGDLHEAAVRFLWDAGEHSGAVTDDAFTCAETVVATMTRVARLWEVRGRRLPELSTAGASVSAAPALFKGAPSAPVDPYGPPVRAGRRRRVM